MATPSAPPAVLTQTPKAQSLPPLAPPPAPAKKKSLLDIVQPFIIGGLSGCIATTIIQPIDMIKVQIQIRSEQGTKLGFFPMIAKLRSEGKPVSFFYRGLDSALIRQITYTTTRMGVYKTLTERHLAEHKTVSMGYKSVYGLTAGFIGALVGNPADLILIRMQADQNLKPELRRNYKNFFDAFSKIISNEGVFNLWRGSTPTIVRAMVLNFGMLGPFDEVRERLNKLSTKKDTLPIRLTASAIAGFLCSFFSLPFDNAKTKMQKMVKGPDGKLPYSNLIDCMTKTVKNEGFTKLWVGFPTFYVRIAPHAMITLVSQEYITDIVKKARGKK